MNATAADRLATDRALYTAVIETDNAWMAAIAAAFPTRRAGDVRFSSIGKGEPGSDLRAAFDRFEAASVAYRDRVRD